MEKLAICIQRILQSNQTVWEEFDVTLSDSIVPQIVHPWKLLEGGGSRVKGEEV